MRSEQLRPHVSFSLVVLIAGCGGSSRGTTSAEASLGCVDGTLDSSVERVELEFGGTTRSYEVHIPPAYDGNTPLPVVLNFHGFTSNPSAQRGYTKMDDTADAHGFVVAYPEGLYNSWNAGACCGTASMDDVDDVGFTRAIINDLGTRGCFDLSRVYATGMSNGGFMSHRLACEASDVIAAIGPVSGVLGLDVGACNPARPVPVIHFHGTADPIVPYDGGGLASSMPVRQSTNFWIDRNECEGEPEVVFDRGMVICETHGQCAAESSVTLCTIEGGGHCWPGEPCATVGNVDLGTSTTDIRANETMWALFSNVRLP